MTLRRKIILFSGVILILVASVAAVRTNDIYFQIKKQITIFSDIYKEVATQYVDEMPPEPLMQRGIRAMLESLDPYTVFIDEGDQQQLEILSSGNYGGIGINAGFRGDRIVVIAPMEGYPAYRSGVRPGDIILKINGTDTNGMTPDEVQQLTIGDVGTDISLEIERAGIEEPMTFQLERERIDVKNIAYSDKIGSEKDVAYIQLMRFGQNASEELRSELLRFQELGPMNGLILDLRNNPGGLLQEAVKIVDKFIEPGVPVVETRGRHQEQSHVYTSNEPPIFDDLPIVVLLNNGSASASEVVAGAFQDLDRAVILGETSFGKGMVQTIRPLSYNTSLKLTVSKYFTPSGRSIQAVEYTHNKDNPERIIADSLRKEFATKNGRRVFEGMGIEPDITVKDLSTSLLEVTLMQQNHYFFFVNDYISRLPENEQQEIPEDMFNKFVEYLDQQNFDYRTSADRQIEELQNSLDLFSDEEEAEERLNELEQLVQKRKKESLAGNRERIEQVIELEWVARVKGQQERVKASLPSDRYVQQGLSLLSRRAVYDSILRP